LAQNEELSKEMLNKHDEEIHNNILPRLQAVEEAQQQFSTQLGQMQLELSKVQQGQSNLELTVMKDGQATRDLLNKFVDHFFKKDELEVKAEENITIARLTTREKIVVGIVGTLGGGGGLIAGILALMEYFK
jgi:chromosome segregation ATPase